MQREGVKLPGQRSLPTRGFMTPEITFQASCSQSCFFLQIIWATRATEWECANMTLNVIVIFFPPGFNFGHQQLKKINKINRASFFSLFPFLFLFWYSFASAIHLNPLWLANRVPNRPFYFFCLLAVCLLSYFLFLLDCFPHSRRPEV